MRCHTFLLIGALTVVPAFGAKDQGIPPDAEHAKATLEKSTRHGEWVDVKLSDGKPLATWVVYPEKKEKAGAVIVIHEVFGLTDWVVVVGLGDRFQIWNREAFQAHRAAQRDVAREGLATMRAQQRAAKLSGTLRTHRISPSC